MYESPITMMVSEIEHKIREQQEQQVMEAVQNVGVDVDKDELLRALQYDRDQYEKGFLDGMAAMCDKWVPVEVRLPEENEMVLVTAKTKKGVSSVNRAYMDERGFWHGSGSMANVTAWMELPHPYGEEEEEE